MKVTSVEVTADPLRRKGHRAVTGEKIMPFSGIDQHYPPNWDPGVLRQKLSSISTEVYTQTPEDSLQHGENKPNSCFRILSPGN
jgi:hypothetical protein